MWKHVMKNLHRQWLIRPRMFEGPVSYMIESDVLEYMLVQIRPMFYEPN